MMNHNYVNLQLSCVVELSSTVSTVVDGGCRWVGNVASLGIVFVMVPELDDVELIGCIEEVGEAVVTGDGVGGWSEINRKMIPSSGHVILSNRHFKRQPSCTID